MNRNTVSVIGTLSFIALIGVSVVFYKERVLFFDISFHLFDILRTGTFAIQNYRIAAFFTQLFPIIGMKANLSLNTIALWYSSSFLLLYFVTFLVILLVLKNVRVALTYFLFVTLISTHTFYWIQSELSQGAAFLFLMFAFLDNGLRKEYNKVFLISVLLLLSTLVVFGHPLLLFAFVFMIIFLAISYPNKMKFLAISSLPYFVIYGIKFVFFKTRYDKQAMGGLKNFGRLFPDYFTVQSNKNFLQYVIHDYVLLLLLFVVVCGVYLAQKNYLKLLAVLLFFFGYLLLINVSYAQGSAQFYIENQYLLLSVFVGIPFIFDVLPFAKPSTQTVIISAIAVACVFRVYNAHLFYTNRANWYRNVLAKTENLPNKKIIYSARFAPIDTVVMTWASSYEFWLLSTLESKESRSVIIEEQPSEFDWGMNDNKHFITKWGAFEYDSLNKNYFRFSDTSHYVKLQQ